MKIFDSIRRLFGEGKIRIEGTTSDKRNFSAKVPYIGDINTLNKEELFDHVKKTILVEYGIKCTNLQIIGIN